MRNLKQYAVEVIEGHSHGKYGKEFYFGMYVPGYSKKDAEAVAMEMLAEMTFDEINKRCVSKGMKPWQAYNLSIKDPIGLELAEFYFTCKAYKEYFKE